MPVYYRYPDTLCITFRHRKANAKRMAQVPGAEWDAMRRCWFAPLDSIGAVLERYPQAKYDDNIWRALGPERLAALQEARAAYFEGKPHGHHG